MTPHKANDTKLVCPYCHNHGEMQKVMYKPHRTLHKNEDKIRRFFKLDATGQENALEESAEVECETCGKFFLYQFEIRVVLRMAKLPVFTDGMRRPINGECNVRDTEDESNG